MFKCPNDCVGKLPAALKGHTIKKFISEYAQIDWKEVVGGKRRGQVYGIADLAANYRQGVSSLTQPSSFASVGNFSVQTEW